MNLIKSYLIPYLIRDNEQERSVIKKANDFISFKFGDVQFLDIMKFLGGATTLDSFLKAYKASETKGFFPYEWFDNPDKLDFPELPPYEAFFSKLRNNNPLDKDFIDYEMLRKTGLDEQQTLKKLQIKNFRIQLDPQKEIFGPFHSNLCLGPKQYRYKESNFFFFLFDEKSCFIKSKFLRTSFNF